MLCQQSSSLMIYRIVVVEAAILRMNVYRADDQSTMPISQVCMQHIRAKLNSYGPGRKFPLLSQTQIENAMKYAQSHPNTNDHGKQRNRREAAVLVPICCVAGQPSVLFTLRSSNVSTHKNQISFPGGHVEEHDESLAHAALRETREELNGTYCYEHGVTILGETAWVPSLTGNPVTPVVAAFTDDFIDENHVQEVFHNSSGNEVDMVFTRTLDELLRSETAEPVMRLGSFGPVFPGKEGKIWGLTSFILRPLLHQVICPAFSNENERS